MGLRGFMDKISGRTTLRARRPGRRAWSIALVCSLAAAVLLGGCGHPEEQSLCTVYADYARTVVSVSSVDATTATASQVAEAVDATLRQVQHLGEVSDYRYAEPIEALTTSLQDASSVLDSVEPDADYATWQPLVADSLDDARAQAARLDQAIRPSCPSGT